MNAFDEEILILWDDSSTYVKIICMCLNYARELGL